MHRVDPLLLFLLAAALISAYPVPSSALVDLHPRAVALQRRWDDSEEGGDSSDMENSDGGMIGEKNLNLRGANVFAGGNGKGNGNGNGRGNGRGRGNGNGKGPLDLVANAVQPPPQPPLQPVLQPPQPVTAPVIGQPALPPLPQPPPQPVIAPVIEQPALQPPPQPPLQPVLQPPPQPVIAPVIGQPALQPIVAEQAQAQQPEEAQQPGAQQPEAQQIGAGQPAEALQPGMPQQEPQQQPAGQAAIEHPGVNVANNAQQPGVGMQLPGNLPMDPNQQMNGMPNPGTMQPTPGGQGGLQTIMNAAPGLIHAAGPHVLNGINTFSGGQQKGPAGFQPNKKKRKKKKKKQ